MCLGACWNQVIWEMERACYYGQAMGFFFSSGINFSPCVPSLQFLGRKETELTMQMSLCSASSYKLKSYKLNNAELQTTPPSVLSSSVAPWRPLRRCSSLKSLCGSTPEAFAAKYRNALASSLDCFLHIHLWSCILERAYRFSGEKVRGGSKKGENWTVRVSVLSREGEVSG